VNVQNSFLSAWIQLALQVSFASPKQAMMAKLKLG
jgi:hypothetical protein